LPSTFTMTVMWPVGSVSNGTTTGFAASSGLARGSSARSVGRNSRARENSSVFFMSEALPGFDGDRLLLAVLAAFDDGLDLLSRPGRSAVFPDLVEPVDGSAAELDEAVPGLEAGPLRGAVGQHALDDRHAVVVLHVQSQKASRRDVGVSLAAEEAAEHLH